MVNLKQNNNSFLSLMKLNRGFSTKGKWGEKKLSKSVFGYFKTKNTIQMAIKLEGGGGKALMAWPLVEELLLCGFPK